MEDSHNSDPPVGSMDSGIVSADATSQPVQLGLIQNSSHLVSIEMSPSTEDILSLVTDKEQEVDSKPRSTLAVLDQTMDDLSLGGDLEQSEAEELDNETLVTPSGDNQEQIVNPNSTVDTQDLKDDGVKPVPNISKYFGNETVAVDSGGDFFDTIPTQDPNAVSGHDECDKNLSENQVFTEGNEQTSVNESEGSKSNDGRDGATRVLRSISRCSAEVEVSFQSESEPGEGEVQVPEDEGVKKFFSENSAMETSETEFFDSFTAEKNVNDELTSPRITTDTNAISIPERHHSGDITSMPIAPGSPIHVSIPHSPYGTTSSDLTPHEPVFASCQGMVTPPLHQDVPILPNKESSPDNLIQAFQNTEDSFGGSITMSDTDRMHDAWLPSEVTRQILVTMATSTPGTYFPDKDHLTMPVVCMDDPQGDPVKELVYRFMGEQEAVRRDVPTADTVSQDEEGVRQLIKAECYRAAIDLCGRLLSLHGQGVGQGHTPTQHTQATLQLWYVRIALLAKVRQYNVAETECHAFGNLDQPDLYYEYYPDLYPGRKGSMVPFSMRLIHAELPSHLGKGTESLDRLYYLHAVVTKILSNLESGLAEDGSMIQLTDESRRLSRELWERRFIQVQYSVINRLLFLKDYHLTVEVLEQLIHKDSQNAPALWNAMGRVYLQIGDVIGAKTCFAASDKIIDDTNVAARCNSLINRGFVAMGMNNFTEAKQHFKDAVDVDPYNAVAVNNMAVCYLYMGMLNEALSALETLVHSKPKKYLQDGVLFNLSTLYELESSRSMHKKQTLLDLVSKHKGDSFNVACLKMA